MVRPAFRERLDHRLGDEKMGMTACDIEVLMLEKRRRRQDDIGHRSGFGHELLMHADEQIVATEAVMHLAQFWTDDHRVGVLDDHRAYRRPAFQRVFLADEDRAETRLIQHAHGLVADVEPHDHRHIDRIDARVGIKRAGTPVPPLARHTR